MPLTIASKSPEGAKKIELEEPKTTESTDTITSEKKSKCGDVVPYSMSTGDGEVPVKKTPLRKKFDEKKNSLTVADKVPKAKAQRAKGSTSLNKTLETPDNNALRNTKQCPSRSNDVIAKEGTERKTPVTTRTKLRGKAEEDGKNGKKRKPWAAVVDKESDETINEKTVEVVEEVPTEEIHPEGRLPSPGNTCSFFEKLQQGVKAYFTSRNSFNPLISDDKNKKKITEGGIRTRARIAKEVKEDPKKRKARKKVKDKKKNSNGGLRDDRFRVMSSTGGQSNSSLNDKSKNFRHFQTMKRKKLYRPKKHCVRIQIPRKGYFYRSTVQFKAPESPPSRQRVESDVQKSKSKVQISRMASTSAKSANLLKKGLKNTEKSFDPQANDLKLRSPICTKQLNSDLIDKLSNPEKVSEYMALKMLECRSASSERSTSRIVSPVKKKRTKMGTVMEKPSKSSTPKSKNSVKREFRKKYTASSDGVNNIFDVLETKNEKISTQCQKDIKTATMSQTSFNVLLNCINKVLDKNEGCDLEITPVRTAGSESFDDQLQSLEDPFNSHNFPTTDKITASDNYDSPDEEHELSGSKGDFKISSEHNVASFLMGEIDLHRELENYMQTIGANMGTKNRIIYSETNIQEDKGNRAILINLSDNFDISESKSNSTYESATSLSSYQNENIYKLPDKFLDRKRNTIFLSDECLDVGQTKTFISQTQLTNKGSDIRKIKSDSDPKKITREITLKPSIKRSPGKSSFHSLWIDSENIGKGLLKNVDSYEKIQPFQMYIDKNSDKVKTQSNFLYPNPGDSLSTDLSLRPKKVTFDTYMCASEIQQNCPQFLETYSTHGITSDPTLLGEKRWKWSPTLQELTDIYRSVLRQNQKIRNDSRYSVKKCASSNLFAFLDNQLHEKKCKAHLVMLSRELNKKLRSQHAYWQPEKKKQTPYLEEYVTMFQNILRSSLTINQITRLNKIISDLQNYSEKNFGFITELRKIKKRKIKIKDEEVINEEMRNEEMKKGEIRHVEIVNRVDVSCKPKLNTRPQPILLDSLKPKKLETIKEKTKPKKFSHVKKIISREKTENTKPKLRKSSLKESERNNIRRISLQSLKSLETVLQSSSQKDGKKPPKDDKLLVTVQLHGDRVLVNKMSYFKNESALKSTEKKTEGTSELIIENVTKPISRKDNKTSITHIVKTTPHAIESLEKQKNKVIKKKLKKMKKLAKKALAEAVVKKMRQTYVENENDTKQMNVKRERGAFTPVFEYNHNALKSQHPIDAIMESSETRMNEIMDNTNTNEVISEIIFQKNVPDKPVLEEPWKEVLVENIFSKDLICDFGWSGDMLDKSPNHMKPSYMISQNTVKNRPFLRKKIKDTKMVKSLLDMKRNQKCKRKGRKHSNSFVYLSLHSTSDEADARGKKSMGQIKLKSRSFVADSYRSNSGYRSQGNSDEGRFKNHKPIVETVLKSDENDSVRKAADEMSDNELLLECYSSELLFTNDNIQTLVTPQTSSSETKHNSKMSLENMLARNEVQKQTSSDGFAIPVKDAEDATITVLSSKALCESSSNSSITIHSDSFLKCFPLTVIQDNYYFLFKSSSNVKFYPGRVCSEEKEVTPFVKFVLTPRQNAEANLPPEQVEIKDRKQAMEKLGTGERSEEKEMSTEKNFTEESSLASIEKFILKLSKSNRRKKAKPKKPGEKQTSSTHLKSCPKKKIRIPGQKSFLPDRKPYHECQMRKQTSKEHKSEDKESSKKNSSTTSKSRPRKSTTKMVGSSCSFKKGTPKTADGTSNPRKKTPKGTESKKSSSKLAESSNTSPKIIDNNVKQNIEEAKEDSVKDHSDTNLMFFNTFMPVLSKIMSFCENFHSDKTGNKQRNKSEAESEVMLAKTSLNTNSLEESREEHLEKSTNTVPKQKSVSSLTEDFASSIESPQRVRSAITQTDDFLTTVDKNYTKSDNQFEEQQTTCDSNGLSKFSSEGILPRLLKIKIMCKNHKKNLIAAKAPENYEAISFDPENNDLQQKLEEIELLNSFLSNEPNAGTLKRLNSTYFDAVENHSDEENINKKKWKNK